MQWLQKLAGVLLLAAMARGGEPVQDYRTLIQQASAKVFPSVVFIKCIRETYEGGRKTFREVSGSGVIVSTNGEVLTNHHVVDKATEVRCMLYDGRPLTAKVLGSDKDTDLALLQLQLPAGGAPLVPAAIGDSTALKEGDYVMAMGAPWGLSRSVSFGIVACARRYLQEDSEYSLWLQTDASISPGNSGGPLVNTQSELVGLNARGVMYGGELGFAVPSVTIKQLVPALREHGHMNWSWTGLQLQALHDFNRNIYFDATNGVVVAGTDPDSPARLAGFQAHDRLLQVNGRALNALNEEDLPDVRRLLGLLPKNVAATFSIARNNQTLTLEVKPREKGQVEGDSLDCPRWDLTVRAINQFANPDLYFHRQQGVFIYGVRSGGNAEQAGLRSKDIVVSVDEQPVATLADVKKQHAAALEALPGKHRVTLSVLRNGTLRQCVLDYGRDIEKE